MSKKWIIADATRAIDKLNEIRGIARVVVPGLSCHVINGFKLYITRCAIVRIFEYVIDRAIKQEEERKQG